MAKPKNVFKILQSKPKTDCLQIILFNAIKNLIIINYCLLQSPVFNLIHNV